MRRLGTRARWAVPAGVVAGVGIIIAATAVATADAAPALPPRTAEQLLTEVAQSAGRPTGPFTATVQESANLGLPQIPAIMQQPGASPGPASGTRSVSIWFGGPQRIRLAESTPGSESDLRLDGRTLWLWNSKTQTATRYVVPAQANGLKFKAGNGSLRRLRAYAKGGPKVQLQPPTPQAAARQILAAVGPTTVVSVQRNAYVAGQSAYQLSLVPRSSNSLVGQVLIAIDASRHIPLRIEVFPRGSSTVAYSFGYTALSFGPPAASNFSFTPPHGATVRTQTVPGNLGSGFGGLGVPGLRIPGLSGLGLNGLGFGGPVISSLGLSGLRLGGPGLGALSSPDFPVVGQAFSPIGSAPAQVPIKVAQSKLSAKPKGWIRYHALVKALAREKRFSTGPNERVRVRVRLPKAAIKQIETEFARSLPKNLTAAQRARKIAAFDKRLTTSGNGRPSGWVGYAPLRTSTSVAPPAQPKVKTIGTSWLTVVATPPSAQVAQAVRTALAASPAVTSPSATSSSSGFTGYTITATMGANTGSSSPQAMAARLGPSFAILHALLKAATPVHGTWGSGRLLQTRLLTVLVTSKGQILAGAVTPSLLYADVALDAG